MEFHKAIALTNYVLKQLDKRLVPVTQDYFSRTLTRIDERDNLSKEQLFNFMAMLMNPQQDTISSFLGEVQKEMSSQQVMEVEVSQTQVANENDISSIFAEVQDWGERGQKLFELDYYEEAYSCYKKAIAVDPNNQEYW
ncbi:MAG: tetratricopeptide repeat protein, partial [Waterburya sp.]